MKRTSIIANLAIAFILIMLSAAIFSADLGRLYETVAAPVVMGNKNLKNVSFVICVESDTDGTLVDEIMSSLASRKVSATFFVAGSWVMKNTKRIKTLHNMGFEIANYGFSGKNMKVLGPDKQKNEMLDTHILVKGLIGVDMKLFLPPMSEYNNDVMKTAAALGYTVILPNRDVKTHSSDATADRIYVRATENMKNGDLIMICPSPLGVQAMPNIIDLYLQREFGIIKVSDNILV